MSFTRGQLETMARSVPTWFHSIDFGQGVVTNGLISPSQLAHQVQSFRFPDLRGKTILDINALDGFFSFEAERLGASRVVALDHYMWAMDLAVHYKYWIDCKERGVVPAAYHTMPYYLPDKMPGKIGFDTAKKALQSDVQPMIGDLMDMDIEPLGTFDVVFYFGSLYHMENPLEAMRRVAAVTKGVALIETEAAVFADLHDHALVEFFESNELNGDVSNWWAPNEKALLGLCRAAGFRRAESMVKPPLPRAVETPGVVRYRAVAHAWK